jgi:transcription elongation GreA/GreB family factor
VPTDPKVYQEAVDAPIYRGLTREGESVYDPPDKYTKLMRTKKIAETLMRLRSQMDAADQASIRAVTMSVRLQRQAAGLDYNQELNAAMAKVLASGYTVIES